MLAGFGPAGLPSGVHAKLEVGSSSDPLEREADETAAKVMRSPAGGDSCCAPCSAGGGCSAPVVRRAPAGPAAAPVAPGLAAQVERVSRGGEPLPQRVKADMEPRFGTDFSAVRIHRDAEAAASAHALGAKAWTLGRHVAFGAGQWAPGTPHGDRLIAHELTHILQERGRGEAPVRRDLLDTLGDAWDSATTAAGEAWDSVSTAAGQAWDTVSTAAGEAWDTATDVLSWTLSAVGRLAVAGANAIAQRFGGSVTLGPDGIIITLPEVELCEMEQMNLYEPPQRSFLPVLSAGTILGPVLLTGSIGIPFQAPSLTAFVGPARVRDIRIRVDPWGNAYSAEGQLYAGAALNSYAQVGAGINVEALGIIPAGEVPIPVEASVEGGLLLTVNGSLAGSLDQFATLYYAGGTIGLDLDTQARLGGMLTADFNGYLNVQIYGFEVCEFIWPIEDGHWEISRAGQFDLPLSLTYRDGEFNAEAGELETSTIAIGDIETGLQQFQPTSHCLTFDEMIEELCQRGVIPREFCPVPEDQPLPPGGAGAAPGGGLLGVAPAAGLPKIYIDPGRYPESATHAWEAINAGKPDDVTLDRPGADSRRARSVGAYKRKHDCDGAGHRKPPCALDGQDYDEYPQALFRENGGNAHVRPISYSDNRGSGASIGRQCRPYADGKKVHIVLATPP